jgi:hypothetical protein
MNRRSNAIHDAMTTAEISVRGRTQMVPAVRVSGIEIVLLGKFPRVAAIRDEEWLELKPPADPIELAGALKHITAPADILTISGELDHPLIPNLKFETDNVAIADTSDFERWWMGLPQEARKNTRRATKRGIEIRAVHLDYGLAEGIKKIYDETPVRQGRSFWHYGKDVATVLQENSSYHDRSVFLGAYLGSELVGFMKWVHVGNVARIMQILCMTAHQDKRPIIALISKAAELCHERGSHYLIYGKYTYYKNKDSTVAEFKRRLGFVQKNFPRYFVPLNWRGAIALRLGMHKGIRHFVPDRAQAALSNLRARRLERKHS